MLFTKIVSRFPFWFLYALAELTAFLAFHVFRYRRSTVAENIEVAFRGKSVAERRSVEKQFYRQFLQVIVELIKGWRFTEKDWRERVPITNPEVVEQYLDEGTPIVLMSGHTANWEWPAFSIGAHSKYPMEFLYKPVRNQRIDRLMLNLRSRHGNLPIPKDEAIREIIKRRRQTRMIGFISDQLPSIGTEKYWLDFLNRPTAFYVGAERVATLTQYAVFYVDVHRTGRGRYSVTYRQIASPPYVKGHEGIIASFVELLEETIHKHPADYLWSHKRWKYTKEEEAAHLATPSS